MRSTVDEIGEDDVVVNGERIEVDPPFESVPDKLVEDILTVIVSFSSRIDGARGGRKRKEQTDAASAQD